MPAHSSTYELLAGGVEALHALCMVIWGIGLPFLFWHRFPRVSELYMGYAIAFVVTSVVSHWVLDECVLTTLARALWERAGGHRDELPFTVHVVNTVAGLRPTRREAVLLWEAAVLVTSAGGLWHWLRVPGTRTK